MKTNQCCQRTEIEAEFPGVGSQAAFNRAGGGIVLVLLEENTRQYQNALHEAERELWMQVNAKATIENAELRTVRPIKVFYKRRGRDRYQYLDEVRFLRAVSGTDYYVFGLSSAVDFGVHC